MGKIYSHDDLDKLMKKSHKKIGFFNGVLLIACYLSRIIIRVFSFKTLGKSEAVDIDMSSKQPENQVNHYDQ
jgi:hypothetical protein